MITLGLILTSARIERGPSTLNGSRLQKSRRELPCGLERCNVGLNLGQWSMGFSGRWGLIEVVHLVSTNQ